MKKIEELKTYFLDDKKDYIFLKILYKNTQNNYRSIMHLKKNINTQKIYQFAFDGEKIIDFDVLMLHFNKTTAKKDS